MASNIDAGVGQHATLTNPTGKAGSVNQNPFTPVEAGKNSTASAYTTVTSSDPLVPEPVLGGVATVTTLTATSGKADNTYTAQATTSDGIGTGATITYTVGTGTANTFVVVDGGLNYAAGDVLTIADDTGVTLTIATIS